MGIGPLELLIIILVAFLLLGGGVFVAAVVYGITRRAAGLGTPGVDTAHGTRSPVTPADGAQTASSAAEDSAMAIARERFARGEINREEFEQIKATLGF